MIGLRLREYIPTVNCICSYVRGSFFMNRFSGYVFMRGSNSTFCCGVSGLLVGEESSTGGETMFTLKKGKFLLNFFFGAMSHVRGFC